MKTFLPIAVVVFAAASTIASPVWAVCPTPASVSGYVPGAYVPPKVENSCSTQQIQDYWTNCRSMSATAMTCSTWSTMNAMCGSCLETKKADPKWGALILGTGIISLNVAGCADIQGSLTCAKAYEAYTGCIAVACEQVCPVTDQASFTAYNMCVQTATTGGCSSYNATVTAQCKTDASANLQQCFSFMTFQGGYDTFAPMFCSNGPPMDAGVNPDSGTGSDSGVQKDSGTAGSEPAPDSGIDDSFVRKGGCHCDSSGASPAAPAALFGFAALSVLRGLLRKRRR